MIIKNATLRGKEGFWHLVIKEGQFEKITQELGEIEANEEVIDADGSLVLPPFIEPHIHLDTTLTAGEPEWNQSGTLFEGIQRWSQRKESLTLKDVKTRSKTA
ncbi:amidohydrolase family protein, partial [Aeromonas veronii]|nr:amidohydrolase family protein [Aeromonas veronii]